MADPGRWSVILKSRMSPVGASRERENPDRCGGVPGWGCCRLVVLLADSDDGRWAADWVRAARLLKPASSLASESVEKPGAGVLTLMGHALSLRARRSA